MRRFVLVNGELGVFLGMFQDSPIWANHGKEMVGKHTLPSYAVTWEKPVEVRRFFARLNLELMLTAARLVEVDTTFSDRASVGECHRAGVPMWNCVCAGEC